MNFEATLGRASGPSVCTLKKDWLGPNEKAILVDFGELAIDGGVSGSSELHPCTLYKILN